MKKKLLFLFVLSMALISFKARAATYNFNFYNNEKEEVPTPTVLPAPAAVVPLAPTASLSSSDVATSKVEEIKESLFSLGYFISMRSNASEGTSYYETSSKSHRPTRGQGLRIGYGKKGNLKVELEIIQEKSNANLDHYTSYGPGFNLKKEFLISESFTMDLGVGGNYLKRPEKTHVATQTRIPTYKQSSYYGQIGLNYYYGKLAINFAGRLGQTTATTQYDNRTYQNKQIITNNSPTLVAGLSYYF